MVQKRVMICAQYEGVSHGSILTALGVLVGVCSNSAACLLEARPAVLWGAYRSRQPPWKGQQKIRYFRQ